MNKNKSLWIAVCVPMLACSHWLETNDEQVASGIAAYSAGDHGLAVSAFRKALAGEGARDALHFDLGTAMVRHASKRASKAEREVDLDLAIASLRIARHETRAALRESVEYNLGNALVLRGSFGEAAQAYRFVLVLNPGNDDARHNLELALMGERATAAGDEQRLANFRRGMAPELLASESQGKESEQGQNEFQEQGAEDEGPKRGEAELGGDAGTAMGEQAGEERALSENENATGQQSEGQATDNDSHPEAPREPASQTSSPKPASISTLSLQKKLDALERRSAELRRESLLLKTTSRVRDPNGKGADR